MNPRTLHFLPITSRSSFRQHKEHTDLSTPPNPDTIRDLTSLATTLIKAPAKSSTNTTPGIPPYACAISKRQIQWQASPPILSIAPLFEQETPIPPSTLSYQPF